MSSSSSRRHPAQSKLLSSIAVAAIAGYLFLTTRDDRTVIEQKLRDLAAASAITEVEHPIVAIERVRALSEHLDEKVLLDVTLSTGSRKEEVIVRNVEQKAAAARRQLNSLKVELGAISTDVRGTTATSEVNATATGSMPGADGIFQESHQIQIVLVDRDGDWRIAQVRTIDQP